MSQTAKNHSIYLDNLYNFKKINNQLKTNFLYTYGMIRQGKYLPLDIQSILNDYPKFPYNYNYWESLSGFNVQRIRHCTNDSVEYLLDELNPQMISFKSKLDKLPEELDEFNFQTAFQHTFFSDIDTLYNRDHNFINYNKIGEFSNILYSLIGSSFDSELENKSILLQIIHFFLLNYLIFKSTNLKSQVVDLVWSKKIFNKDNISNEFNNFIDNNIDLVSGDLTKILLKHVYSFVLPTDNILNLVQGVVKNSINELKGFFQSYNEIHGTLTDIKLTKTISNVLLHNISVNGLVKMFKDYDVFTDTDTIIQFDKKEEKKLNEFYNRINNYGIRQYMNLLYTYKFYPIKFVNIISMIVKEYVENKIYTPDDIDYNFIKDIKRYLASIENNITDTDINNYIDVLPSILTTTNFDYWFKKDECSSFCVNLYFLDYFDEFIKSNVFVEFITLLLRNIYNELVENGYVDYGYNWNVHYSIIEFYFISLFKQAITRKKLFGNLNSELNALLENLFMSNFSPIENETVIGDVDGTRSVFVTRYQFEESSIEVYIDGILQDSSTYTINGSTKTIMFNIVILEGSLITVNYQPQYDIIISKYDEEGYTQQDFRKYINYKIDEFKSNNVIAESISKYIQNLYLGTVTKQTYFNILRYFRI